MEQLISDEGEKMEDKNAQNYAGSHNRSVLFSDTLLHDKHPDTAVAYKAKVQNTLGSDDITLAAALQNADEGQMWKAANKVELTLLIDKCHMFQIVRKEDYSSRTSEEKIQAHDIAETQAKQASRDIQVQILSCVAADKDWELMYFTPFLQ